MREIWFRFQIWLTDLAWDHGLLWESTIDYIRKRTWRRWVWRKPKCALLSFSDLIDLCGSAKEE